VVLIVKMGLFNKVDNDIFSNKSWVAETLKMCVRCLTRELEDILILETVENDQRSTLLSARLHDLLTYGYYYYYNEIVHVVT